MSSHRNNEVPGNVLATAAMTERLLSKAGLALYQAANSMDRLHEEEIHITAIRFKPRGLEAGEWLAVVTAEMDGSAVVAFHSGDGFVTTVTGICNRIMNGSLKWKEDEYAK